MSETPSEYEVEDRQRQDREFTGLAEQTGLYYQSLISAGFSQEYAWQLTLQLHAARVKAWGR